MSKSTIISHKNVSLAALSLALIMLPFSTILCHSAFIAFIVSWAAEGKWNEKLAVIKNNIILQLLVAFALLQFIGIVYTENVSQGWFSLEKKIFFFLVPIALATTSVKFNEKDIRFLFYLFAGTCLVAALVCVAHAGWQTKLYIDGVRSFEGISYLDSANLKPLHSSRPTPWLFFSYVGLANGIVIHPTYFSLYLAFCTVFLLSEILTNERLTVRNKLPMSALILFFSVFLIFLSSRIIIISIVILYFSIACYWFFVKKLAIVSVYVTALIIIVCTLLYLNPVTRYRNLQEVKNSAFDIKEKSFFNTSAEIRASLWWLGWKSYKATNPWIGTGAGDVSNEMQRASERYQITNVLNSNDPHNQYLHVLIGNGIIGLLIFLSLLAIPFIRSWLSQDYFYVAFIFLFAALCMTESALELQKGIAFFAIMFPLLTFHRQTFQGNFITLNFFSARG